ncbi:HAD-IA family hydrolase [Pseudoalteromonas xiamenensis]
MRFNRAIGEIKALSFDLDDTLYDNRPIIKAAIRAMLDYVEQFPEWQEQGEHFWRDCRRAALDKDDSLEGDVTRWRHVALHYAFTELGFPEEDAVRHATGAFNAFMSARCNITVSEDVLILLNKLRQKYPLVAITNGNVDVEQFNLKGYFDFVLQAGRDGTAKPANAMYLAACARLNIEPSELLHIGDSLDSDVQGARQAGCASIWLENQFAPYSFKGLADLEIQDIRQLALFL